MPFNSTTQSANDRFERPHVLERAVDLRGGVFRGREVEPRHPLERGRRR
jgi:hypothetical protein